MFIRILHLQSNCQCFYVCTCLVSFVYIKFLAFVICFCCCCCRSVCFFRLSVVTIISVWSFSCSLCSIVLIKTTPMLTRITTVCRHRRGTHTAAGWCRRSLSVAQPSRHQTVHWELPWSDSSNLLPRLKQRQRARIESFFHLIIIFQLDSQQHPAWQRALFTTEADIPCFVVVVAVFRLLRGNK